MIGSSVNYKANRFLREAQQAPTGETSFEDKPLDRRKEQQ